DKESNTMIFATKSDNAATLYTIDLKTAKATKLYDLVNAEQLNGFFAVPKEYAANVPGATTNSLSLSVSGTNLNGTIAFYPPRAANDGSAKDGALTYHLYDNGKEILTGETEYKGSRTSIPFEVKDAGYHRFAISFSDENGEGPKKYADVKYLGLDTPKAPASLTYTYADGKLTVRWGAVSYGLHDGTIDRTNLVYRLTRWPEGKVVTPDDQKTTSFVDEIPTPATRTTYWYTVEAITGDLVSPTATSTQFELGPIAPPYHTDFNVSSDFFGYSTLNNGSDTKKWEWNSDKCARVATNAKPADNYLLLPVLKLKAGQSYEFTLEARAYSSIYTEEFEVVAGKTPTVEGLTETVIAKTSISGNEFKPFTGTITALEDGDYYVAIHATTPTNGGYLYVNSIDIASGVSELAPGAVTDLKATADPSGIHSVTLTFKTPVLTLGEKDLSEISKVEIYRDGEFLTSIVENVAPGTEVSYTDNKDLTPGLHSYSAVAYNQYGAGAETKTDVFVGFSAPKNVESVTMTEPTNGHVVATWTAVTQDTEGRALTDKDVKYNIYMYLAGETYLIEKGVTETRFEYEPFAGFDGFDGQRFVQTLVEAETEGGVSKIVPSLQTPVGTPYSTPWAESFADCTVQSIFANQIISGTDRWVLANTTDFGIEPADGDKGMMYFEGYGRAACALLTGKIDLGEMIAPAFVFQTYHYAMSSGSPNENLLEVEIRTDGGYTNVLTTTLDALGHPGTWEKVTIPLDDYAGQVIQIRIAMANNTCAFSALDDMKVTSVAPFNLTLRNVSAPLTVNPNEEFTITAEVENMGTDRALGWDATLLLDGEPVETISGTALEPEAKTTLTFKQALSVIEVGAHEYTVDIEYGADMYMGDNSKVVKVEVRSNSLPVPTDLLPVADNVNNAVVLTWNAPEALKVAAATTENFDAPALSWATAVPGWKFIDNDKGVIGSIGNKQLPITGQQSFFVFDNTLPALQVGNYAAFTAHSGNQYLCSMYSTKAGRGIANDDWAISPELTGEPQVISLWASSFPCDPDQPQYYETFQLLYSTTGTEIDDFTLIEEFRNIPAQWKEYSAYVPEGARYFAIRCVSDYQYMLFVDDVKFMAKDGATETIDVKGYNVYRDGKKLNSELVPSTTFTDNNVNMTGKYTYRVSSVFDKGESLASDEAFIDLEQSGVGSINAAAVTIKAVKGGVQVNGAVGETISVFTLEGSLIRQVEGTGSDMVALPAGIYAGKVAAKTAKLLVK
ncbi:MAG: choice-of-anchor J domain-containing protein, partial [Muribaculaceae bacterium]|nr:choice-of-anchor J domain-containing protein [Muribaculaceae bacterium]